MANKNRGSKDSSNTNVTTAVVNEPIKATVSVVGIEHSEDGKHMIINVGEVLGKKIGKIQLPTTDRRILAVQIPDVGKVLIKIDKVKDKPGRPVDPNSRRQAELKEKEARRAEMREAGLEIKKGRPPVIGSKSYNQKLERTEKLDAIKEQLRLQHPDWNDEQINNAAHLPKGRQPVDGSKRSETIQERITKYKSLIDSTREATPEFADLSDEQMLKHIQMPKGRPKEKVDEVVEIGADSIVVIGEEVDMNALVN